MTAWNPRRSSITTTKIAPTFVTTRRPPSTTRAALFRVIKPSRVKSLTGFDGTGLKRTIPFPWPSRESPISALKLSATSPA